MRVAVVGGAGFLGSYLAERLTASGETILVLDDLSTGRIENLSPARRHGKVGFHTVAADNWQISEAIKRFDPDLIYHLALATPGRASRSGRHAGPHEVAAEPLRRVAPLCEAAVEARARLVLAANAADFYGAMPRLPVSETQRPHPMHAHGAALYAALRYVEVRVPGHWCALALGEAYGPRQRADSSPLAAAIAAAAEGRLLPVPESDSFALDYLHVADAADALIRAATRGVGLINVGSGVATPFSEIVAMLVAETDSSVDTRGVSLDHELPNELSLDTSVARAKLGWSPQVPLNQGLKDTLARRA